MQVGLDAVAGSSRTLTLPKDQADVKNESSASSIDGDVLGGTSCRSALIIPLKWCQKILGGYKTLET